MNSNRWVDAMYGLLGIPEEPIEGSQELRKLGIIRAKKSLGSCSIKKLFPNLSEKVEPHTDEDQRVVYEEDEGGKTITTLL
jgi:hypothetical protein